jgi:hypothetical protein
MSAVCSRGSVGLTTTIGESGRPEGVVLGVLEEQAALSNRRASAERAAEHADFIVAGEHNAAVAVLELRCFRHEFFSHDFLPDSETSKATVVSSDARQNIELMERRRRR